MIVNTVGLLLVGARRGVVRVRGGAAARADARTAETKYYD